MKAKESQSQQVTLDQALAILLLNKKIRKGSKRTVDLVTLSNCWKIVKSSYKSTAETSNRLGVSNETIRVYELVCRLDDRIKKFIRARLIDSIETIEAISRLQPIERQVEAAKVISAYGLNTASARSLVQYAKTNPTVSIEECIKTILRARPQELYVVVVVLADTDLRFLENRARSLSISLPELVEKTLDARGLQSSCKVKGTFIMVNLAEGVYKTLKKEAIYLKTSVDQILYRIIKTTE